MGTSIGVATGGPGKKCDIRDWPGKTLHFGFFLHRIDVASRENAIPTFSVGWVLVWRGKSRRRKTFGTAPWEVPIYRLEGRWKFAVLQAVVHMT